MTLLSHSSLVRHLEITFTLYVFPPPLGVEHDCPKKALCPPPRVYTPPSPSSSEFKTSGTPSYHYYHTSRVPLLGWVVILSVRISPTYTYCMHSQNTLLISRKISALSASALEGICPELSVLVSSGKIADFGMGKGYVYGSYDPLSIT